MNAKFFDLKQEKQDRMINAALKIFAINGYKHASTDDIVKEAGISKGLLFHYFDSKIGVFSFIYDYCARYMALELSSAIDPSETSYMEIRRQMEVARMQTLRTYPYLDLFLKKADLETLPEAAEAIASARENYRNSIATIMEKADMSAINAHKNSDKLLNMLDHTIYGMMSERFESGTFDAQSFYKEVIDYIAVVEKLLK